MRTYSWNTADKQIHVLSRGGRGGARGADGMQRGGDPARAGVAGCSRAAGGGLLPALPAGGPVRRLARGISHAAGERLIFDR